jgi:hypothetical protein
MMQPTVPIEPIRHRAAWRASELGSKEELAIDLAPRHLDAIERGIEKQEGRGTYYRGPGDASPEDDDGY